MLADWLAEVDVVVEVIEAWDGAPVPRQVPEGINGVIPLGGVMGAMDDDVAPWLPDERALLVDAVERGIPVLGICLGGQLLAAALGGRVTLGPATEIGVVDVQLTAEGQRDRVLSQAVPSSGVNIPAAQWHQDNIVDLPADAVLLLTNPACRVQGYRVGDSAYGLQLHPELDFPTFAGWAAESSDEALQRSGVSAADVNAAMQAAEPDLIRAWRPMAHAWAELVHQRAGA
jgi:GMP synthase-like glutamine amidotransferase